MKFRGMSGCLRQAVINSKLENKFNLDRKTTIYNDKYSFRKRRFNWEWVLNSKLTEFEKELYKFEVNALLVKYNLTAYLVFQEGSNLFVYTEISEEGQINELRKDAAFKGYKLVRS